jgi:ribonuclease BN (tRNA processing enzyme)
VASFDECDRPGRFQETVRVAEYDPSRPLEIGDTVISFFATQHYVPAWAMRISGPGARDLGYTGDTGPARGLAEFLAGVEVLVAEATLLEPGDIPVDARGSLTAAEAGELASASGAETLVLTHMWEEFDFALYRAQAAGAFPGQIELAAPGVTVSW